MKIRLVSKVILASAFATSTLSTGSVFADGSHQHSLSSQVIHQPTAPVKSVEMACGSGGCGASAKTKVKTKAEATTGKDANQATTGKSTTEQSGKLDEETDK